VKRLGVVTLAQQDVPASLLGRLPPAGEVVVFGNTDRFIAHAVVR
jgi:hypothetical protein